MSRYADTPRVQTEPSDHSDGFIARTRGLPVISWFFGERSSAACGTGAGVVGGACCFGGAIVLGLGLAGTASVASFVDDATPYVIGVSIAMMVAWLVWIVRRTGFKPKALAGSLVRQTVVMGSIYGVVLAAAFGLGALLSI